MALFTVQNETYRQITDISTLQTNKEATAPSFFLIGHGLARRAFQIGVVVRMER